MAATKQKHKHAQKAQTVTAEFLEEILDGVNARCEAAMTEFATYYARSTSDTLLHMWECGKRVRELQKPEYSVHKKTGEKTVGVTERLAIMLNRSTSWLNKMGQLHEAFSGDVGKKRLLGLQLKNGRPVTWEHLESVINLYSEDGSTVRFEKILGIMVKESLTPEEVERRILTDRALRGKQQHAGGRPVVVPATPQGRLASFLATSGLTLRKWQEIHGNPQYSFTTAVRSMSQDEVLSKAAELTEEFMLARVQLRALLDMGNDVLLTDIDQALQHVRQCALSNLVNVAVNGAVNGDASGAAEADRIEKEDAGENT